MFSIASAGQDTILEVLYLICYDILLQTRQILLQNTRGILLQNATEVITKCVRFFMTKCGSNYKMRKIYYKMRQLLQNATILLQNVTAITKRFATYCNVYYNLRQYTYLLIYLNSLTNIL